MEDFDNTLDDDDNDDVLPANDGDTAPTTPAGDDFFSDEADALPDPAQTIPFQIQFQGWFMVSQRIPIHLREEQRGIYLACLRYQGEYHMNSCSWLPRQA